MSKLISVQKISLFLLASSLYTPLAHANYGHYEQNGKGFMVDLNSIQLLNKQKSKFNVSANLIGFVESHDIPKSMLNQVESKANLLIDCKAKTLAFQSIQVIYKPDGRVLMENDQPNFKINPSQSNKMESYMIVDLCKTASSR